jgi:hypothetical protein
MGYTYIVTDWKYQEEIIYEKENIYNFDVYDDCFI